MEEIKEVHGHDNYRVPWKVEGETCRQEREMKEAPSAGEFHSSPDCTQSSSQRKKAGLALNAINSK